MSNKKKKSSGFQHFYENECDEVERDLIDLLSGCREDMMSIIRTRQRLRRRGVSFSDGATTYEKDKVGLLMRMSSMLHEKITSLTTDHTNTPQEG